MARGGGSGFGLRELPRIARGRGSYLFDEAGKCYIDGSGGPAVFSVGHSHPEVNAAISRQLEEIAYGYRYLFTSAALESLTETLLRVTGGCYREVIYTADGSEAVESALKVALQHFAARGLMQAPFHLPRTIVARQHARGAVGVGILSPSPGVRGESARHCVRFRGQRISGSGGLLIGNARRPPRPRTRANHCVPRSGYDRSLHI